MASLSLYFCMSHVIAGASGISLPYHLYSGSISEGHRIWAAMSPQCVFKEWLESVGLHHCGCRVSKRNLITMFIHASPSVLWKPSFRSY